jgi:nitrogen-specific signal transduction histidine kinase/CheY-like chemotaxis protein
MRRVDGKITHFIAVERDITERRRLEDQLFQSQKLETVSKLAGGIAHEFNSIFTAIIGQSELLRQDLPADSSLLNNVNEISQATERAAILTRQLLSYGRKQLLQPVALNINQVLGAMEGVIRQLVGKQVSVSIQAEKDLWAVKADAGQLEQVMMNVVMNASEAMSSGGKLALETANVIFDEEGVADLPELRVGGYVMIAITDTGSGMSAEVKARVFEPFFSTKPMGEGTGLGLSTSYGIIKQSGGHISVYSELGRGTTVRIYLPRMASEGTLPPPSRGALDWPRGTETILLVEDDPALREMAAELLRRLGYHVLVAGDGLAALSLVEQRKGDPIDLMFTDMVMPQMDGRQLFDRVRSLHPKIRILFTTAYTEKAMVQQGVLNQGVTVLQKPFSPSALAHKVREVLDQPKVPSAGVVEQG